MGREEGGEGYIYVIYYTMWETGEDEWSGKGKEYWGTGYYQPEHDFVLSSTRKWVSTRQTVTRLIGK